MDFDQQEVFKGKTFSSLLKDIYTTTKGKEAQINSLISELKPLINNIGDATIIVPLIKEYMEIAVKNDEHLIKMASVVQRAMARTELSGGEFQLTDDEKKQLLDSVKEIEEPITPTKDIKSESEK